MKVDKMEKIDGFFATPTDYLACRKTNTAPNIRPNIDIKAIEQDGISLEQLDSVNAPVYRYQTQITIHGVWPDTIGRCLGYKHLFTNKNQSIGIRYGAIDGLKKKKLRVLSRWSRYYAFSNSTENGFYLNCHKHKQLAIKAYKCIEKHKSLFVGSVSIMHDTIFTGNFYVLVYLCAIPEKNFWLFSERVLKVSEKKAAILNAKREAEQAARKLEVEQAEKINKERAAAAIEQARQDIIAAGFKPFTPCGNFRGIKPSYEKKWINGSDIYEYMPRYKLIEVRKKSFGPCYLCTGNTDLRALKDFQFDWSKKAKRLENPIELLYI